MRKTKTIMAEQESNLGNILRMQRRVTLEQLNTARAKQDETERAGVKQPIGAILVEQGSCRPCDIDEALAVQKRMRDQNDPVGGLLDMVRQRLNTPAAAKVAGG